MKIEILKLGDLQTNCYILSKDNSALLIDPASEGDYIKEKLKDKNLLAILITHYHPDHIGALDYFDCPIYDNNLGEKEYEIGPFKFEIIKTYGHTTDSVTYYFKNDKVMFTGDFLFEKTVGRWDFETGDYEQMKTSILKIKKYPDDITIYPGHGNTTNLGYEKINNIYFK